MRLSRNMKRLRQMNRQRNKPNTPLTEAYHVGYLSSLVRQGYGAREYYAPSNHNNGLGTIYIVSLIGARVTSVALKPKIKMNCTFKGQKVKLKSKICGYITYFDFELQF